MDTQYPVQVFGPEMAIHDGSTKAATGGIHIFQILNLVATKVVKGRSTPKVLSVGEGLQPVIMIPLQELVIPSDQGSQFVDEDIFRFATHRVFFQSKLKLN